MFNWGLVRAIIGCEGRGTIGCIAMGGYRWIWLIWIIFYFVKLGNGIWSLTEIIVYIWWWFWWWMRCIGLIFLSFEYIFFIVLSFCFVPFKMFLIKEDVFVGSLTADGCWKICWVLRGGYGNDLLSGMFSWVEGRFGVITPSLVGWK